MADVQTKVTISARVAGLAQAAKDAIGVSKGLESIGAAAKKAGKLFGGDSKAMREQLKAMSKETKQATRDMEAMGKVIDSQAKSLRRLAKENENLGKASKAAADALAGRGGGGGGPPDGGGGTGPARRFAGPSTEARGSFQQGLLQGVLPEAFIQRGPGALTQAAGALTGRAIRGVAGAGATLLTGGLQGSSAAVGALGQLPFGGVLSSALGSSLQSAQAEAGARRGFQSLLPFTAAPGGQSALEKFDSLRTQYQASGRQMGGYSRNETAGLVGQMAAAGGGYASGFSMRSVRQALAAQTGLGIDVGTSGVLARGDALGAGSAGGGASTLAKTIADGISLRLEGSELTRYVQEMAGSISQFAATGIKVDAQSQGGIARLLQASGGYTGTRAAALSGGVMQTMNQVAYSGPQDANQFLLLQSFGYDPSNPESYYAAQEKMDAASPGERAEGFNRARKSALGGLKGMSRLRKGAAYANFARSLGENLRIGEAIRDSSTSLSPFQSASAIARPDVSGTMQTVSDAAAANTFESTRQMAAMQDADSKTGGAMIPSMLSMDVQSRKTLQSLSKAGSAFLDLASKITDTGTRIITLGTDAIGLTEPVSPQ